MAETFPNPFNITKAVDLSDQEIKNYWVDIRVDNGFLDIIKPTSPMPMYVLGGKGSGKTHLMRYLSYPLQKLRCSDDVLEQISEEGYVGVYFRCGGLNASRFSAKGQSEETWAGIFAYFMELWFAQLVLQIVNDAFSKTEELIEAEVPVCDEILGLFDRCDFDPPRNIPDLISLFGSLQKTVNSAVNNCVISRVLEVDVLVTSGRLIFGIPQVLSRKLPSLAGTQFLYLVDEFENLAEGQQVYFNTLLREREAPSSFKIGARLYGVRTHSTMSAGEANVEGSEFETIYLDSYLRRPENGYQEFAKQLCTRRLAEAGYPQLQIDAFFQAFRDSKHAESQTSYALSRLSDGSMERPYFRKLRKRLEEGLRHGVAPGVNSREEIDQIIPNLMMPAYPLLEKTNVFLLYGDWYDGEPLVEASRLIGEQCKEHIERPFVKGRYRQTLGHFKADLIAQLLREFRQKQLYIGFDAFVDMSDGLPRNLLIILKHVFKWALFEGERPFRASPISPETQQKGVKEASEWFYRDARIPGSVGEIVRQGIDNLATLLREIRFSDKPTECSLLTFSTDLSQASTTAQAAVELAEKWSLLICISGGQRDRNSMRVDEKYQLNGMLSPHWDLPISRRGALPLKPEEINAIFDPEFVEGFQAIKEERVERMMAPFFGKGRSRKKLDEGAQASLPGFENG